MELSDYRNLLSLLGKLEQALHTEKLTPQLCDDCFTAAKYITEFTARFPDVSLALCNCKIESVSEEQHRLIKSGVLLALLAHRTHYHEYFIQHMLAACLLQHWCFTWQPENSDPNTPNKVLNKARLQQAIKLLDKLKLPLWRGLLTLSPALAQVKYLGLLRKTQLHYFQRVAVSAFYIAEHYPHQPFDILLRDLYQYSRDDFNPALEQWIAFPGPIQAGIFAVHAGHSILILKSSTTQSGFVVVDTRGHTFRWANDATITPDTHKTADLMQWFKLFQQNAEHKLPHRAQDWPIARHASIFRVPKDLTDLLTTLAQPDKVNMDDVSAFIEREPALIHFLCNAATRLNNNAERVDNTKQAIMTFGLTGIESLITQYVLQQRLALRYFPLQPLLLQFTSVAGKIAHFLGNKIKSKLSGPQTSLCVSFATSGLFLSRSLKIRLSLQTPNQNHSVLNAMHNSRGEKPLSDIAHQVATAWHQPKVSLQLLKHLQDNNLESVERSLLPDYCVLVISILWAREWLLGQTEESVHGDAVVGFALDNHILTPQTKQLTAQHVSDLLFYPINR